jgi:DNA polymerase-3 subunit gamma/tau
MVFEDVIGQTHVTTTLRNAIASDRLSHAYIFSGPRGVGKTTAARILAKAINCEHPKNSNPDNKCDLCKEITEGRSVNVFEIDGASNRGVEEIRNLREAVRYAPARGKYKVYIIDEVHMLTKEAFNALLKTLEEPPSQVLFIFATTEVHKVPLTILSRCQRFEFRRNTIEEITSRLKFIAKEETISINDDALFLIAKKADGSMRDAQSIFDQVVSFGGEQIDVQQIMQIFNIVDQELYFNVTDLIKSKDSKSVFALVEGFISKGYDVKEFLAGLNEHFRSLLIVRSTNTSEFIEASEVYKRRYEQEAAHFKEEDLLRLIKITSDTDAALRWSQQPRFKLEFGLLQMVKMDNSVQIDNLLLQLDELKKKLNGAKLEPPKQITLKPQSIVEKKSSPEPTKTPTYSKPVENIPSPSKSIAEKSPAYREAAASFSSEEIIPAQQSTPSSLPAIQRLSVEEAMGKWSTFVAEASRQRVAVGAMLSQAALMDVKENKIQIGCPDDYHLEGLKRNREFLTDLATKVYGAKIRLEAILANVSDGPQTATAEKPESASPQPAKQNDLLNHPVVRALIREFDAKLIQ